MTDPSKTVPDELAGNRVDVAVAQLWDLPRNQAGRLVTDGHARVNNQTVAKSQKVNAGDQISVTVLAVPPAAPPPALPAVLYDDDQLLIVDKPAGMVVHPGVGHSTDTLVDALQAANIPLADTGDASRPGIVHRLDKDTSGVLVVAKTALAFTSIVDQLQQRSMHRAYVALVAGVPKAARGVIDGPIGRDPKARTRFAVVEGGKPARTHYQTRATGTVPNHPSQSVTLLDLQLDTGRTHQIRVHLATIGVGIVGDGMYGVTGTVSAQLGLKRPFLHAHTVTLKHPVSGATVTATAPLPAELRAACERAGVAW